jgi:hypothetical protein
MVASAASETTIASAEAVPRPCSTHAAHLAQRLERVRGRRARGAAGARRPVHLLRVRHRARRAAAAAVRRVLTLDAAPTIGARGRALALRSRRRPRGGRAAVAPLDRGAALVALVALHRRPRPRRRRAGTRARGRVGRGAAGHTGGVLLVDGRHGDVLDGVEQALDTHRHAVVLG